MTRRPSRWRTKKWRSLPLKLKTPLILFVFLAGQRGDLLERNACHRLSRVPGLEQRRLDQACGQPQVDQEIRVAATGAVGGLPERQRQRLFHQPEVKVQQKRAMKNEKMLFAPLCVAGELESADGQVGVALQLDRPFDQRSNGRPVPAHDELICGWNAMKRARFCDAQNQRVIETTRPLEDSPAAGGAAQDGDCAQLTKGEIDFLSDFAGITEDDEVSSGFPETQQFAGQTLITEVQKGFVARQILRRRRQSEIAVLHGHAQGLPNRVVL